MRSYQVADFGEPLKETETPTPRPQGDEVLLAVRASGVCHSDLHIWDGGYDLGGGRRLKLTDRGVALPMTLGHETAGEIVAIGPEVRDRKVGETCLVYPWIGCGACRACREGAEHLCAKPRYLGITCDGGYADHILVPGSRYLLPLDGLDPIIAAPLSCSGVTTYSALRKLGDLILKEPILIIGAGGLGLIGLNILKAIGGVGAVVVDISEARRQAALAAGALAVVDGAAPDAAARIAERFPEGCRAALDIVGSPETTSLAFNVLAKGGRLILVGLFGGSAPWSLPLIPMKAITIQGSFTGSLDEMRALLDLAKAGKIAPIPITRRKLEAATRTLEDLRDGRIVGRAVMTP